MCQKPPFFTESSRKKKNNFQNEDRGKFFKIKSKLLTLIRGYCISYIYVMGHRNDSTPGERKIAKIGGRLSSDYYHLRNILYEINERQVRYLNALGLVTDIDTVLTCLSSYTYSLKNIYIKKKTELKAKKEGKPYLLTTPTKGEDLTEEQKRERRETHRKLAFRFNDISKKAHKQYYIYDWSTERGKQLKVLKDALFISDGEIKVDEDKFIEVYGSFIKASESELNKQHQAAADGINKFFGGAVPITDKELERYFMLEDGIMKVNPLSVNTESYLRLGARKKIKVVKVK